MPDSIGNIAVPEIVPSGTFPLVSDYPFGRVHAPEVVAHQFGSGNAKIEQRFLRGTGASRFTIRKAWLREAERIALRDFWESKRGAYGAFTYNAPNEDGSGTTPYLCRFANEPLSWEMVADWACSLGVTIIEIPTATPEYALNQTVTRFPSAALQAALLQQAQQVIPLVRIVALQPGYPAIYLSDRRCTIGSQLYQARLLEFDGISQGMGNEADEARFVFGNADRVMRNLANDVDLFRATLEFSLFHVGTGTKLDLWKGDILNWSVDAGPEFHVTAGDGLYELNLPYPTRKITRTCWKPWNKAPACPASTAGGTHLDIPCDKGFDTPHGCRFHSMDPYFGAIIAKPQAVRIKDNSTGTWGFGRSMITSVSLVADSIYDEVVPEIYTDSPMPVNCKIANGREESDFNSAVGIVGEGPLGAFGSGHTLDGQPHHGPGTLGLMTSLGDDPNPDKFGFDTDNPVERAAGTAFLMIRRSDAKGVQMTRPTDHAMQAVVASGLRGWVWTAPGARQPLALTNPVWIAINMLLKARGLRFADAATCEQYFDVNAAIAAASICDEQVSKIVGSGTETQFKFRGVLQEQKPLRDWIQEVLMNCLGYYTFTFGKLKLGVRVNSSAVEAFSEGNILLDSLRLEPLKPSFNHLTANFADEEFDFVANTVTVQDDDHADSLGVGSPLFLKSNLNLAGTASKSQAARIAAIRLREELGGITGDEWKRARQIAFRTTVLALNTEPGMVCSLAHEDMPNGAGEFRITGWKLNKDFSIEVAGRTTTDTMYDLAAGPKPEDVPVTPPEDDPYLKPAPNVVLFKAGKSNGDGTFTDAMHWDETRQRMLIDWGCMLPADRRNWSGVQIWIKSPDGAGGSRFTRATGVIGLDAFRQADDGTPFYYDTIAIEAESVPSPAQMWTFLAVSYDRFGRMNVEPNGDPAGVGVNLTTLTQADYVLNFTAAVVMRLNDSSVEEWGISATWANPGIPRYVKTRLVLLNYGAPGNVQALTGDNPLTDVSALCGYWPWPQTPQNVRLACQTIFGDGSVADLAACPAVDLVVSRTLGGAGAEYTAQVTGYSVAVAYPQQADGTYKAKVTVTFVKPDDPRWGGVEIRTTKDGATFETRAKTSSPNVVFELPVSPFAETYSVYAVGYDVQGRLNTLLAGVTPRQDILVGTAAGQLDLSKAKATSYDPNIFTISNGKMRIWAMDGSLVVTGSIASSALNATEIMVGGGGAKPGKFGVYNAFGVKIGFIGVEGSYEGLWAAKGAFGGSGFADANVKVDSGGASIQGATLNLTRTENPGAGYQQVYQVMIDSAFSAGFSLPTFTGVAVRRNAGSYAHRAVLLNRGLVCFNNAGQQVAALASYNGDGTGQDNSTEFWGELTLRNTAGAMNIYLNGQSGEMRTMGRVNIQNAAWNAGRLQLGNYQLWVDALGRLRIKSGDPASDTDGTVVGTQS